MIIGSYSLHLYCSNETWHGDWWRHRVVPDINSQNNPDYRGGFADYVGDSYQECVRYARKDGWVIAHDRSAAYCPQCKKKRGVTQVRNKAFVNHRMHAE